MTTQSATLAILFADICDSTRLYETLGDHQALDHISRTLNLLRNAATMCRGRVLKTIGDELMCVFPDAGSAAEASTRMQHDVGQGAALIGRGMNIRIGFQYGAVIENGGDVFGDAVNIAARLVALARPGQILTTRNAATRLEARVARQVRHIDDIPVKGRQEAVAVCEIPWQPTDDATVCVRGGGPRIVAAAVLKVQLGERELAVDAAHGPVSFGRDPGCDIVLQDRMVSREHARIEWRGDGCLLTDLSSNGTWLAFEGQPEIRLRRQQVLLHGRGRIGFGHSCQTAQAETAEFSLT